MSIYQWAAADRATPKKTQFQRDVVVAIGVEVKSIIMQTVGVPGKLFLVDCRGGWKALALGCLTAISMYVYV